MSMTPNEMVAFFGDQANDAAKVGLRAAMDSSDYYLASVNCGEIFKCRLMQGLICWRTGSNPTNFLAEAVQGFADAWNIVMSIGGDAARLSDTPAERVRFSAYLIGHPGLAIALDVDGLEADRLLDAVLGNWLFDSWNDSFWEQGIKQLRLSGSKLAVDTYQLYREMARAISSEVPEFLERGESLFNKRKSDSFYSGGDKTEGGGEDNKVTVDYRLASLVKRVGYMGKGLHVWNW